MTYLYYKTSTMTSNVKPNEKTINQWEHLADKRTGELHNYRMDFTKRR